jgi:hypothetical protein
MHESDHHRLVRSGNLSSKNPWEADSFDSVSERDASKLKDASRVIVEVPCYERKNSESPPVISVSGQSHIIRTLSPATALDHRITFAPSPLQRFGSCLTLERSSSSRSFGLPLLAYLFLLCSSVLICSKVQWNRYRDLQRCTY